MRARGGFIGTNVTPASAAVNSAASGVWTVREAESLKRAATWPSVTVHPTQITGLQLWLDASDASTLFDATTGGSLVAADGGVARWEDKSGNGRHATQSTSANRPARKTAIQNGLDVLRFDGSNDFLAIPSSTAAFKFFHSSQSTFFCVFRHTQIETAAFAFIFMNRVAGSGGYVNYLGSGNLRLQISNQNNEDVVLNTTGNNYIPSNTFAAYSIVTNVSASPASARSAIRKNSSSIVTANEYDAAPSSNDASANTHLGSSTTPGNYWNGDIAEIIIYNSALSDAMRAAVESYLIAKWAIT
jgi:hypothetical protein